MNNTQKNNLLRAEFMQELVNWLVEEKGMNLEEDLFILKSNQVGFYSMDCEEEEKNIILEIKIPTKNTDIEDMHEEYLMKLEEKEIKEKERLRKKQKKIQKDKENRAKKVDN